VLCARSGRMISPDRVKWWLRSARRIDQSPLLVIELKIFADLYLQGIGHQLIGLVQQHKEKQQRRTSDNDEFSTT
ncbi:hypothetical protein, partial [Candidatus Villigracilis affinis]|uniref:hypothetical protein n=1 Tax=Candidatus Villigracilis affinis TaxID=3140682 RepID=UPI0031EDA829